MPQKPSFQTVLDSLLDSKKPISQAQLKLYSDLDPESLRLFTNAWPNIPPKRKLSLLDKLVEHFDEDTLVSYEDIGKALLSDPNGEVRVRALRLLAECDDPKLINKALGIFLDDAESAPRLEAVKLLGQFLLLGEYEKISGDLERRIEDAMISVLGGEGNPDLRRRSLEALGFSSRMEIPTLIESAFERVDLAWVASALRAMGHSQDERWTADVMDKLLDEEPLIKSAAIEAAGMLAIQEAVPLLIQTLDDEETEDDLVAAAIWSLSQIGGDEARTYLVGLADQTEDEELSDFLDEAIENLEFMDGLNNFDLFDFDDEEDDDDELEESGEDE